GPDVTTQDLKPAGKENPSNVSVYEIVLSGVSGSPLERNISVASPTKVELSCKLDKNSQIKNPQVTWKKGSDTISHTTKSENSWSIQVTILDSSQLGSYSCILKGKQEISAVFHLQVPKIEGKDKPIITYEGDAAVMVCKTDYIPIAWTWYMTNGSKQVAINDSMPAKKYVINRQSANATRLKVLQLTKEDGGLYWCEATFQLGKSKGKLELKVLSIMAPLKPFVAIVAEVVIFVTTIFLYEWYSKKKEKRAGDEREFDQIERL
ncbi:EMB protein, partial [Ptilonorhynchus violaceus]|nr:EMB protein [Ptilonorhynchus violaceus]